MSSSDRAPVWMCICICLAIGGLLTIILVPMSLERINFYEAGLKAQVSTGKVDKNEVWTAGNHLIGPDFSFKTFPISMQLFDQRIAVWTKSSATDAGSTISLDISFIYKLRTEDIGKLYAKVAHSFEPLVVATALDAIRNSATLFGVDDYIRDRSTIEKAMFQNVSVALKENIFCDVLDLQLRRIILSPDGERTKLASALQVQKNAQEQYVQKATVIEEETSLNVLKIHNEGLRLKNTAKAQASVIQETAAFEGKKTIETARSSGIKFMLSELGLTEDEHKASLDYITTLMNNKDALKPYVNFGSTGLLNKLVS